MAERSFCSIEMQSVLSGRTQRVNGFIFFQVFLEHIRAAFFEMINVVMGFKAAGIELDHGNGNIGTVIRNALKIGQQIIKDEALKNRACTLLQALYVMHLRGVWSRTGRDLDPMLPLLVMSTFLFCLLGGLGFVIYLF